MQANFNGFYNLTLLYTPAKFDQNFVNYCVTNKGMTRIDARDTKNTTEQYSNIMI